MGQGLPICALGPGRRCTCSSLGRRVLICGVPSYGLEGDRWDRDCLSVRWALEAGALALAWG